MDNTSITDSIINAVKAMRTAPRTDRPAKGYKVVKAKDGTRFEAQIGISSRKIYLGTFDNPEDATAAYQAAKARIAELRARQG